MLRRSPEALLLSFRHIHEAASSCPMQLALTLPGGLEHTRPSLPAERGGDPSCAASRNSAGLLVPQFLQSASFGKAVQHAILAIARPKRLFSSLNASSIFWLYSSFAALRSDFRVW